MPISSNQKLDKIISSLILNQASIIQKISGFSSTSDNVFLIDSFENYNPTISGLYISNKETDGIHEIKYYDNDEGWLSFVKPTTNIIDKNSTNLTVPTSKSVYDLMNSISGKISGSVDESILENYALKSDLEDARDVHYLNTYFEDNFKTSISGLYIDAKGEARFYKESGTSYTNISYPLDDIITSNDETSIPTTNAVFNFVKNISGNFNVSDLKDVALKSDLKDYALKSEISGVNESLDNYALKSELDNYALKAELENTREVHYLDTHFGDNFSSPVGGIYIDTKGEARFYKESGTSYTNISYPLNNTITNDDKISIPTTNAVFNFVKNISGNFNELYLKNYVLKSDIVNDLIDKENISSEKVASTFATANYIKLLEDKIITLENKIELIVTKLSDLVKLGILPKQVSEFTNDDIGTIISIPYTDSSGNITEPIEFEVVGVNHHKDINDETKPTITLMTKNIIRRVAFDAKEQDNPDSNRANYGNNRWSVSNIRQWLNSEGAANEWFTPQHDYDEAPNATNIYNESADYVDEAGFLAGFSDEIKRHIATVKNKTILCDSDKSTLSKNYEETEDKAFLPSYTELGFGDLDSNNPEGSHLVQKFTDNASRDKNGGSNDGINRYWMRTPYLNSTQYVYSVNYSGGSSFDGRAYNADFGAAVLIVLY